jgi:hypothetical protein
MKHRPPTFHIEKLKSYYFIRLYLYIKILDNNSIHVSDEIIIGIV